jgi:hypothetical protein
MMIAIAAIGLVYSGNITGRIQSQLAMLIGDETARMYQSPWCKRLPLLMI